MRRRLRESTFSAFTPLKEHNLPILPRGTGTPVAEYAEQGPYRCQDCVYVIKRSSNGQLGLCDELHVKRDPKIRKDKHGHGIIDLIRGCCRFHLASKKKGSNDRQ